MKIARAFGFAFTSSGAGGKLIRGGCYTSLFFTVFFPFVVVGYLTRLLCDLLEGRNVEMPHWRQLSALFNDGLQPVLIALAYYAPVMVLSTVDLYYRSTALWGLQALLLLGASALFPLAVLHAVTSGSFKGAFQLTVLCGFVRKNAGRVIKAWIVFAGLALLPLMAAIILSLITAVPIAFLTNIEIGATIGFSVGVLGYCFALFPVAVVSVYIWAEVYRASTPFVDDSEGASRASVVMPPSLNVGEK